MSRRRDLLRGGKSLQSAITESCRELSQFHEIDDNSFIAENTVNISNSSFNGSSKNITFSTRKTFAVAQETDNPMTARNIRTVLGLTHVIEMVSNALLDIEGISYGKTNYGEGRHLYTVKDVTFEPEGCKWNASVKFSLMHLVKSHTNRRVERLFEGTMPIQVECSCVVISDSGKYNNSASGGLDVRSSVAGQGEDNTCNFDVDQLYDSDDSEDGLSSKHYSIDVTMKPTTDIQTLDKLLLKSMSTTLSCVTHDINKQLNMHDLPEFTEGCKGVAFRTIYQLNAKIKSGTFATVCLGTHRATGKRVAIKCVHRKKLSPHDDTSILCEVNILSSIKHEHICTLLDFFVEEECYFIVMPVMEGGDLFDRVGKIRNYDEGCARDLVFQMLKAISHIHENNIAHCDLKPKNLLLENKHDDASIFLADFGFASRVYAPNSLHKQCGTPYFVAPEILMRKGYDTKADMWSVGVIVYSLLSGGLPFTGKRHLDLFKAIIAGEYTFDDKWNEVSEGAKDLVRNLLVVDPLQRFSAEDALNHDWIRADSRMLRRNALGRSSQRMRTFNARLSFKSAILVTQSVIRWRNVTRDSLQKKKENFEGVLSGLENIEIKIENDEIDEDNDDDIHLEMSVDEADTDVCEEVEEGILCKTKCDAIAEPVPQDTSEKDGAKEESSR